MLFKTRPILYGHTLLPSSGDGNPDSQRQQDSHPSALKLRGRETDHSLREERSGGRGQQEGAGEILIMYSSKSARFGINKCFTLYLSF